ncbi:MAG TPA: tetratricopeptide repeat protein [Methylophaga aminisulfidivorans]|uniref:Tetratricopeptide repeat protein n=1 Tax=Methylophaga aminisulfidivorans TaxID=230105 RepID=A0A7C1VTQ8_9GAMM|nr:tetratricopeptide repeat protein [Methylophaga aminisulfidivorans]
MNLFKTLLTTLLFLLSFQSLYAAENDQYLLTEKTYKSLNQAQELMGEEKYTQAKMQLTELLKNTAENPYENTVVLQTLGFLYSATEQYKSAAQSFQKALDSKALPEDVAHTLRYNLAQLLIADEQYTSGIRLMEQWLTAEKNLENSVYVLLASAYYRTNNFSKAAERIRIAIKNDPSPKEDWYRLLLSSYLSLKQYKSATTVLETLITQHPQKSMYWQQLSALYSQQDKQLTSLAVKMLARRLDLSKADTLTNLANMYRYLNIPYKSATLLETGLQNGVIKRDFKHLESLANSWLAARQHDEAAATLTEMLPLDSSGKTHLKLGQLFIQTEQWKKARDTLGNAKKLVKSDELGRIYALLGTAYFNEDNLEQAKQQFNLAAGYASQKKQASQWLSYITMMEKQRSE